MTIEELKALGLTDDQIKKVMASHGQSLNAAKDKTKADLDAKTAEVDNLNKQLKDRDKDIKNLKKSSGDNEELSKQLSDLQEKYKTDTANLNEQLAKTKLNGALAEAMSGTKARNADVVKKMLNMDEISLNSEGQLIGLDEQISKLQETDAYLFDLGTKTSGTDPKSGKDVNPGNVDSGNSIAAFAAESRIIN